MAAFDITDNRGGEGAIHLNGYEKSTAGKLRDIASSLAASYQAKPKEQSLGDWLAGELTDRLQGHMDAQSANEMSAGILDNIQQFNAKMDDLRQKKKLGMTQDEWLEEELMQNAPGATEEEKKENLLRFQSQLAANDQMAKQTETSEACVVDFDEGARQGGAIYEEQKDSGSTLRDIAKATSVLAGAAGIANVLMGDRISEVAEALSGLDGGIDLLANAAPGEEIDTALKSVAASALNIVVAEGHIPFLNAETVPLDAIENVAIGGVETIKAVASFAAGVMDGGEAMDQIAATSAVVSSVVIKGAVGAGLIWAARLLGAPIGVVLSFPPVQGVVKQMAEPVADKAANVLTNAIQKLKPWAVPLLQSAREKVAAFGQTVAQNVKNFVSNFF